MKGGEKECEKRRRYFSTSVRADNATPAITIVVINIPEPNKGILCQDNRNGGREEEDEEGKEEEEGDLRALR